MAAFAFHRLTRLTVLLRLISKGYCSSEDQHGKGSVFSVLSGLPLEMLSHTAQAS